MELSNVKNKSAPGFVALHPSIKAEMPPSPEIASASRNLLRDMPFQTWELFVPGSASWLTPSSFNGV
jgi:hypothetical protein